MKNKYILPNLLIVATVFWGMTFLSPKAYSQTWPYYQYMEPQDAGPGNWGIKAGIGSACIDDWYNSNYQLKSEPSLSLSLYGTMLGATGGSVEFSQEFGFVTKGFKLYYKYYDPYLNYHEIESESFSLGYLELNNIIKVKLLKGGTSPIIFGGIYLSWAVMGYLDLEEYIQQNYYPDISTFSPMFNEFDWGIDFGTGVDFGSDDRGYYERWGGLDIRYSMGMKNLFEDTDNNVHPKNSVVSLVFRVYLFTL